MNSEFGNGTEIRNQKRCEKVQYFTVSHNLNSEMGLKLEIRNYHEEAQHFTQFPISDFSVVLEFRLHHTMKC